MKNAELSTVASHLVRVDFDPREAPSGGTPELLGHTMTVTVGNGDDTPASFSFQRPKTTPKEDGAKLLAAFIAQCCKVVPAAPEAAALALQKGGLLEPLLKQWQSGKEITLPAIIDVSTDQVVRAPASETTKSDRNRLLLAPPTDAKPIPMAAGHSAQYRVCLRALSLIEKEVAAGSPDKNALLALRDRLRAMKPDLEKTPIGANGSEALVDAGVLLRIYEFKRTKVSSDDIDSMRREVNLALFSWDDSPQEIRF